MHRFFLPPEAIAAGLVRFPTATAHQLRAVLRLRPGDEVLVLDNAGKQYTVRLTQLGKNGAEGQILAADAAGGEPPLPLTLYQSMLKRDKFEWVLQKGTEIGVSRFVPLVTQRTLVQGTAVKPAKMARWQKIITEAAEQCRRGRIPQLDPPLKLGRALQDLPADTLALIPWEEEQERTLPAPPLAAGQSSLAVFIGPEGGFSAEEVDVARRHGCLPVTLGPRILRAETAALACTAVLLHYWERAAAGAHND